MGFWRLGGVPLDAFRAEFDFAGPAGFVGRRHDDDHNKAGRALDTRGHENNKSIIRLMLKTPASHVHINTVGFQLI